MFALVEYTLCLIINAIREGGSSLHECSVRTEASVLWMWLGQLVRMVFMSGQVSKLVKYNWVGKYTMYVIVTRP